MEKLEGIAPGGGSTGSPLNLQRRMARLQQAVALADKRILDCGCGPGDYLIGFLRSGFDAYGIEFETEFVDRFQLRFPEYANRIMQGDLENTQQPDNSFDFILYNEVLEHVPDVVKALREGYRILKPGGYIAVFSPNRLYPFESHSVKLKATNRSLPVYAPFIPYVPMTLGRKVFIYWARNFWPSELRRLVKGPGFHIISTDYIWQTFEDNSNRQIQAIMKARAALRKMAFALERVALIRSFGISQFIVARKDIK